MTTIPAELTCKCPERVYLKEGIFPDNVYKTVSDLQKKYPINAGYEKDGRQGIGVPFVLLLWLHFDMSYSAIDEINDTLRRMVLFRWA